MLNLDDIRRAVAKVGQKYKIKNAYLFGSYARGEAKESSDVDLIIDDGGNIKGYFALSGFRNELIKELGTNVDVLTVDGVLPKFFDFIKNDRILLYGA